MIKLLNALWKAFTAVKDERRQGKALWRSKTIWVNALAVVGVATAKYMGVELDEGTSVAILASVNFLLRLITKEPTGWK